MIGKRFRNGVELSGGEWQKIAIARAYMREADVLILDEPTAALDARSEYEVFRRFKELSEGKTAILISHRFSSVRMADRILVLADGNVEAAGRMKNLSRGPAAILNSSSCRPRATGSHRYGGLSMFWTRGQNGLAKALHCFSLVRNQREVPLPLSDIR